jgi:cell division septal protein FtsQ
MSLFRKKEKNKNWKRKTPRMYSGVPRKEKREERSRFSRFLFWLLSLIFLGVCAYLLIFSPLLGIETVSVEGNQSISSEEIIIRVQEAISGNYYWYFPKNNFFLVNKQEIDSALRKNFNRLELAAIEKRFPKAVLVKVKERQPEMVWCSAGVCYLIDKEGLVYTGTGGTDEEMNSSNFLTVIDDNSRPVDIGKTTIGKDFIEYLKQMDALIANDLKLEIEEDYHTPALASQEIFVRIKEGEGWTLKLSSGVSPDETKKIIQTLFDKELDGEKRKNLDYIDLRVKGKVYYKLKT